VEAKPDILQQEERRQAHRKLLLLIHSLAAFFTALVYLSELDLGWLHYWRRGAGVTVLSIALPPLLPYIISAVHSWRTATYNRLRTTAFLLILIMGAIGVFCAILGTNGMSLDRSALLWVFAIQAAVYFFSAEFLFDVD
jgi:hypothetical protein